MAQSGSWDIVTGVGLTALGVAAARALETSRTNPLVNDPYAEAFVRAADAPVPMPTRLGDGGLAEEVAEQWELMSNYLGIRSRFFDEFFAGTTEDGPRQVVLLAAGLDTRAYRLDWAPGTTVYEIDAPKVLEFKAQVLAEQNALPHCDRRAVTADLREDWPQALRTAGFDPQAPTAWLAEGLLPFLPDEAKESLFTRLHQLSPHGSRIAVEHLAGDVRAILQTPMFQDMARRLGFDMADLWPTDQHFDVADWLTGHGWQVTVELAAEAGERYGRPLDAEVVAMMSSNVLLTARV